MRNQLKIVYSALTIVAMLGLTSTVHGVPSFARQTGLDCNSCHAPIGFPVLNAFGQAFKAGGYTQASEDNLMGDGEALSIPKNLGVAAVAKMRTHFISKTSMISFTPGTSPVVANAKTQTIQQDQNGTNSGLNDYTKTTTAGYNETNLPDEWALWTTGRIGKHVGFATEIGRSSAEAIGVLSFKMPIVYDIGPVKLGVVPYWTDAQGPGFGFENTSTGAVGNIKMFEGGPAQSARMYIEGNGASGMDGKASGVGIYVWHPMGYIYYSPFLNAGSGTAVDAQMAHNIRAVVSPSFAGIDLALGFQWMFGNWGAADGAPSNGYAGPTQLNFQNNGSWVKNGAALATHDRVLSRVDYLGFDLQVMGNLGLPVMLVGTFGMSDGTKDIKGGNKDGSKVNAWTVLLNATVIEDLLNVGAGIRMANIDNYAWGVDTSGKAVFERKSYKDDTNTKVFEKTLTDNQVILEAKFNLARNLRLSATGYLTLNKVDVANDKGLVTPSTVGSAGGLVITGNGASAAQENKLTLMLFGGF